MNSLNKGNFLSSVRSIERILEQHVGQNAELYISTATESMTYIAKVCQDEKAPAESHTTTNVLVAGTYIPSVDRQQNSSSQNHYLTFI
jgi:hypothetical protein